MNSQPRRVSEDDVSEGSSEYHAELAAPYSSSEGEVAKLELERQSSVSLAEKTEQDRHIAQLTEELALKSTLLEQAEANAAEASKRAGLELPEHADRLLTHMQARARATCYYLATSNMKRSSQTCVPSSGGKRVRIGGSPITTR